MTPSLIGHQAGLWKELSAVAYALIDGNGCVLDANRGFEVLLPVALHGKTGHDVGVYFINPRFSQLIAGAAAGADRKIFTFGMVEEKTYSLGGWFLPQQDNFLFLAEHDISGLAKISDTLLEINKELSRLQREVLSANRRLEIREQQIRELSLTDFLTGVANRRQLDEALDAAIGLAVRHGRPLSVVMIDIDHFKSINDDFGHETGDRALRAIADLLKQQVRKGDLVARFGGEEFMVLMAEADVHQASVGAERLRGAFASLTVSPVTRRISASFGVTQRVDGDTVQSLLARSDLALYQAKAKGRDRVEVKMP